MADGCRYPVVRPMDQSFKYFCLPTYSVHPMIARGYWAYFAGVIVILLIASGFIVQTLPPRTIVMAAGPDAQNDHGEPYKRMEVTRDFGMPRRHWSV